MWPQFFLKKIICSIIFFIINILRDDIMQTTELHAHKSTYVSYTDCENPRHCLVANFFRTTKTSSLEVVNID
jgi:hypothetical protein